MPLLQQESEKHIRSFLALPVPLDVKEALAGIQHDLKGDLKGVKWTNPAGLHITLKFLGEIPQSRIGRIGDAMTESALIPAFDLGFGGLGVFPGPGRARARLPFAW